MTDSEIDDYIRLHYRSKRDKDIGRICDLTKDQVRHRRLKLGLASTRTLKPEPPPPPRDLIEPPEVRITPDGIQRVVVLPDIHVPYHDVKAIEAVLKYIERNIWDVCGLIGDFIDMDTISSFNKGKPGNTEGRYIAEDFKIANALLDRIQAAARKNNPHCKFFYLEGNHEERIDRFIAENPMFKGYMSVEKDLRLQERGVEWVRSWSDGAVYRIGRAAFNHGKALTKYHAFKMVDDYDESIFYGHTHDMMCIPKAKKGGGRVIVGQSIGCLCSYEQKYMQGAATKWQQGFLVMYVHEDGYFTYYTPRIFSSSFVAPDGIKYESA